jgi:hypothetical protein
MCKNLCKILKYVKIAIDAPAAYAYPGSPGHSISIWIPHKNIETLDGPGWPWMALDGLRDP